MLFTGTTLSPALKNLIESIQREASSKGPDASGSSRIVNAFKVTLVQNYDRLDLMTTKHGDLGAKNPLELLKQHLVDPNEPAYYILRRSMESWWLVLFLPELTATKVQTIYAASKSVLTRKMKGLVVKEFLFRMLSDVDDTIQEMTRDARLFLSTVELEKLRKAEEEEKARQLCVDHAGGKTTDSAISGGFHTITLPLTDCARSALQSTLSEIQSTPAHILLDSKRCKWVELCVHHKIDPISKRLTPTDVDVVVSKVFIEPSDGMLPVSETESRFYVLWTSSGRCIFIQSVPRDASVAIRYLYALCAKPLRQAIIEALGSSVSMETMEINAIEEAYLRDAPTTTAPLWKVLKFAKPRRPMSLMPKCD